MLLDQIKKNAIATTAGDVIELRFPYDPELISKIKAIPGRKWIPNRKIWTVPRRFAAEVQALGFVLPNLPEQYQPKKSATMEEMLQKIRQSLSIPLMPFQEQGVMFVEQSAGKAIIADEMGLGKTVQSIAWLAIHPEARPAIIVTPAAVKINWGREIQRFTKDNPQIFIAHGTTPHDIPQNVDFIVINYDLLQAWQEELARLAPKALVLDECHYVKNRSAKRTKAILHLVRQANIQRIIALSGTPITNRPSEFFTTLNLIRPQIFRNWWQYAKRFCALKHNGFGWDATGASNTQELHELLARTCMIRRTKAEVLDQLPDKRRAIVPMEITNRSEYLRAERDFRAWLKENSSNLKALNAEALAKTTYLRQLAAAGKIDTAIKWIKDALEQNGKLIVFAVHKQIVSKLMEELNQYNPVKIDGSTKPADRQKAIDAFQGDPSCRVFVGNIRAAGVGITLTEASAVVFVELAWTPGDHDQAEDRAHRIGQTKSVTAYYLIAEDTIEEKLLSIIDKKRKILSTVLDGREAEDESTLIELLHHYNKEKEAENHDDQKEKAS